MSLNDLASLGTFVSSFAVLVSLIFLGIQTRQSTRNQRATIHHERLATVQELALLGTQAEAAELGIRGSAGDESLSPVQTRQYLTVSLCTLRIMEELFYQHRDGMLDEARWATTTRRQRGFLSAPGFRAAWRTLAETFEPDYRAWVDALACEATVAADPNGPVTAWKAFVKQELEHVRPAPQST